MARRRGLALGLAGVIIAAAIFELGVRVGDPAQQAVPGDPSTAVGSPDMTFEADARGVQTFTEITGVRSLSLSGSFSIDLPVSAIGGDEQRNGGLRVTGGRARIEGTMQLRAGIIVRPGEAVIEAAPVGTNVVVSGDGVVSGDEITFTQGEQVTELSGNVAFTSGGRGLLRIEDANTPLRWLDPPERIEIDSPGRTLLSWAGGGSAEVDGRSFSHEFARVAAIEMRASIVREGGRVRVRGTGRAQQVYLDGAPQLRTQGSVDEVAVLRTVAAGRRGHFTWAPRNTGGFDMVMTGIRATNSVGRWLRLGLAGVPRSYGGEERPVYGGVTQGFGRGKPIRSVLPPFDADRRDITVSVPAGTGAGTYEATVVVEGNFPPISVTFVTEVPAQR